MRVKICGITNLEDAQAAIEAGCDALGFIFADSLRKINIENASYMLKAIPPFVSRVAVFSNQAVSFIEEVLKNCPFDTIQFHGQEDPHSLVYFKPRKKIIKTIHIKDAESLEMAKSYDEADAFLLDTYSENRLGGTGKSFDWNMIGNCKELNKPLILSGGLNPDNVTEAIKKIQPFAVDVSSGVEETPGRKSKKLMQEFIKNAKNT